MKQKVISALLLTFASTIQAGSLYNKQLAGPPEEFELMQPSQPEMTALMSKTALIPVSLNETKTGNWVWSSDFPVDSSEYELLLFNNGSKNWQVELTNPVTHITKLADEIANEHISNKFGMEKNNFPAERFSFTEMQTGNWKINIKSIGEPDQFEGFVMLSSSGKQLLQSYKTTRDQITDHRIHFVTSSTTNEKTLEIFKDFNPVNSASMLVTDPSGAKTSIPMYDDGIHGDALAHDGIFGGDFLPEISGQYHVQIKASGINPDGSPFLRTTEHMVPVIDQTITMPQSSLKGIAINDDRMSIEIPVQTYQDKTDQHYRIYAEVWGKDSSGVSNPVSWISTISPVENDQLKIELDAHWLALSKTVNSFELRNLRIEDADNFIPLVEKETVNLNLGILPKSATKSYNGEITEEMLMGSRPASLQTNKSGSKLLLVHGYCSSDVWGPYQGQFSNSAVFYDLDQNRSHDEFARRIRDFGAQYSSFGVVAHSQGGAASLHLYTYYWSGLDYSSGSRLIQSVGTPYQGTPLAGNLAAIGDVFGVGCGTNTNLTTSGAASWLAGIPTWARSRIYYHTTSFETKWWRYDYCSMGTDAFLSDPEDGVIEKSRGQLSGGNNMGHKTGWCHTQDMRDPGQTGDSSRNYNMSSYANR